MLALILLLLPPTQTHRVDEIEINHVYTATGERTFTQAILWDWRGETREVVAWRMLRGKHDGPEPVRGHWRIPWGDGWVTARVLTRSWTQYDVEIAERQVVPVCERRGLR